MLPEGADECGSAFHAPEPASGLGPEFEQVLGTEVGQGMLLQVPPEVFDRVEFGGVAGKLRQMDLAGVTLKEGLHLAASMDRQAVPDHQQGF